MADFSLEALEGVELPADAGSAPKTDFSLKALDKVELPKGGVPVDVGEGEVFLGSLGPETGQADLETNLTRGARLGVKTFQGIMNKPLLSDTFLSHPALTIPKFQFRTIEGLLKMVYATGQGIAAGTGGIIGEATGGKTGGRRGARAMARMADAASIVYGQPQSLTSSSVRSTIRAGERALVKKAKPLVKAETVIDKAKTAVKNTIQEIDGKTPESAAKIAVAQKKVDDLDDLMTESLAKISRQEIITEVPSLLNQNAKLAPQVAKDLISKAEDVLTTMNIPKGSLRPEKISDTIRDLVATGQVNMHDFFLGMQDIGATNAQIAALFRMDVSEAGSLLGRLSQITRRERLRALGKGPVAKAAGDRLRRRNTSGNAEVQIQAKWRQATNIWRLALVSQLATASRNFQSAVGRVSMGAMARGIDEGMKEIVSRGFGARALGGTNPLTGNNRGQIVSTMRAAAQERHPIDILGEAQNIVGQIGTGVRNVPTRVRNVGAKTVNMILPNGVRARINIATGRISKTEELTERVFNAFPNFRDTLFTSFSSDVILGKNTGVLSSAEKFYVWANGVNRAQEYVLRRGVFAAHLDRSIQKRFGRGLEHHLDAGGEIPVAAVRNATQEALEVTFAATPKSDVGKGLVALVNSNPITQLAIPFPRFIMNAVKTINDFMPTGYLKLLTKRERDALRTGDFKTIGKATTGSAMLGVALLMRSGRFKDAGVIPGSKWYEFQTGENPDEANIVDVRPFNPMVAHLFVADLILRAQDGTLRNMNVRDFTEGFLGTVPQVSTSLGIINNFFEWLQSGDPISIKKSLEALEDQAGGVVAGLANPALQIKDFSSEFLDEDRTIRETRGQGLGAKLQKQFPGTGSFGVQTPRIPGAEERILDVKPLPEFASPTRSVTPVAPKVKLPGDVPIASGIVKQILGTTIREPKNLVEREIDRLNIKQFDLRAKTGIKSLDILVHRRMGPMMETLGALLINNPNYAQLGEDSKEFFLRQVINEVRKEAIAQVEASSQEGARAVKLAKIQRLPRIQLKALDELTGGRFTQAFEAISKGVSQDMKKRGLR